jgi:hypothetical protein
MRKKIFVFWLISIFLLDTAYTFLQNYYTPFDGDMAGGIVPAEDVKPILANPLGFKVFMEQTPYPNPNRFFSHWSFYKYFNTVPIWLQNFSSPIESAYLSCAIAKTSIQVVIILLVSLFIAGAIFKIEFLLAAVLISQLFQTNGYRDFIGIIDPATTYTFFYALPTALLLIYFAPLFLKRFYGLELKRFKYVKLLWIPLALITSLSGPLNPGVALAAALLTLGVKFFEYFKNNYKVNNLFLRTKLAFQNIEQDYYFFLVPIVIFSLYSLYLGKFNSVDFENTMPLLHRYGKLPQGVFYTFTKKLGPPVLLLFLGVNVFIIWSRFKSAPEGKRILNLCQWIGIFSLVYILLLPLGGYRNYRPYIVRYDTMIPVALCLMFLFGKTTIYILSVFSPQQRYKYALLPILVWLIFAFADKPHFDKNACEKNALLQIARSKESVVKIDNSCAVLAWHIIENPKASELNVKLLRIWGIINEEKLYYQEPLGGR